MSHPSVDVIPLGTPSEVEAVASRWQTLWELDPHRTAFGTLAFQQALAAVWQRPLTAHFARREGDDVGGALVASRQRGPYRVLPLPPFVQYSALAVQSTAEADVHAGTSALGALSQSLASTYDWSRLLVPYTDMRAAQWQGWSASPRYTYRLALSEDGLLGAASTSTRRTVRKHADDYRVDATADLADIVELCRTSYARQGRDLPGGTDRLLALAQRVEAAGLTKMYLSRDATSGVSTAGVIVLHADTRAHYWVAGSVPGPAMTVLLAHILEDLRKHGLRVFDFVGANTASIAEFKRRFGPRLEPYYVLERCTRPVLRLALAVRDTFRSA